MKDIKLSELGNIDYIPKDRNLCYDCVYYNECPYDYECPTLYRLMDYNMENREL